MKRHFRELGTAHTAIHTEKCQFMLQLRRRRAQIFPPWPPPPFYFFSLLLTVHIVAALYNMSKCITRNSGGRKKSSLAPSSLASEKRIRSYFEQTLKIDGWLFPSDGHIDIRYLFFLVLFLDRCIGLVCVCVYKHAYWDVAIPSCF